MHFSISSIPCLLITFLSKKWPELKILLSWKYLPVAIILSIILQWWRFLGLAYTSANNAAIVSKSELLFTFLIYALVLKTEKYTKSALIWALLISIGIIIVLFKNNFQVALGDIILLWIFAIIPFGNYLVQKGKEIVSSFTLVWMKSIISGPLLIIISLIFFEVPTTTDLTISLPYILFQGLIWFFLHHILWAELISRESTAKMLSFSSFAPLLTFVFSYFFLWEIITLQQFIGSIIVIVWIYLSVNKDFLR